MDKSDLSEQQTAPQGGADGTEGRENRAAQLPHAARSGKKAIRNFWIKSAALFLLIGLSIFLLFTITDSLTEDSIKSFPALMRGANLPWVFVMLGVVLLYILFESAKYFYILFISTKKHFFRASLKVMLLGKYYDGITPLGTGGQPFQIYYLHKKNGIPSGVATAVPLVKFIITTFVYCTLGIIAFCCAPRFMMQTGNGVITTTMLTIAWVSMALNFSFPVLIIAFSLFPNFGKKCIAWIVHVLARMKLIKHKYAVMHKYIYEMREYRRSLKTILHKWWHFIPLALISIVCAVCSFSMPFFVIMAFVDITPTFELFSQILCLSLLTFYSAALIPTPGNSGAQETSASLIFASVLSAVVGGALGWIILIWRLLTYYIYIIAGVGINIFEIVRSAVRTRRAARAAGEPPR